MKRFISSTLLAACIALSPITGVNAKDEKQTAIFVLIENGGTITDKDAQSEAISFMLGELADLRKRRATRDTQIHLVLSAMPTEVSWSGTPQQLYDQGARVLELVALRETCSDLVLAWEQIALTARITRPDDLRLIAIGPAIHAGFPCDDEGALITLPQPAPVELRLGEMAGKASYLRMLNVHADQDQMIFDHLEAAGVLARVDAGELDFDLMGAARTRAVQGRVLGGR